MSATFGQFLSIQIIIIIKKGDTIIKKGDTNDKRVFIQLNGSSSDYKNVPKAVWLSISDSVYPSRFGNSTRNEVMKWFVTSKVTSKIKDNTGCLPCFK